MLDPILHGALVVIAAFAIKWVFAALGIVLDEATLNTLAAAVVTYILSLFGLSVVRKIGGGRTKGLIGTDETYKPPFIS